jgi:capsular exopolysaccharide synthesis family protein
MVDFIRKLAARYSFPSYVIRHQKAENGIDGRLVAHTDRNSVIAEQYRVLRTNLYSLSPDKPVKTIVITSSQSQEGKSVTACNLSYTLSLDTEKKVLLVDSDLRRPTVHTLFSISRKPGFSDVLSSKVNIEHFLAKPAFENLYILPSGAMVDNPSELLSSAKIKDLIEMLKTRFDYIIFDTPPVINVTDASILGSICDAVLLIVKAEVTPKEMVEESFNMLKRAQADPKACILSNVTIPLHQYYLSKYRYYYKYRYVYSKKNT